MTTAIVSTSSTKDTPDQWFAAVLGGDLEKLKSFGTNFDINTKYSGFTAIEVSMIKEDTSMMNYILTLKPNLNICSPGFSPLVFAVLKNDKELVKLILDTGVYVDIPNEGGDTALSLSNDIEIVRLLLASGADLEHVNHCHMSILAVAIYNRNVDKVRLLAEVGVEVDNNNKDYDISHLEMVLVGAYEPHNEEISNILIKHSDNLNSQLEYPADCTILQYVCKKGYTMLAHTLIKKGVDINKTSRNTKTPLEIAVDGKWSEIIKMLTDAGAK